MEHLSHENHDLELRATVTTYAQALINSGVEVTTQDMFDWVATGLMTGQEAGLVAAEYIRLLGEIKNGQE